jgi:hypothetical protein
MTEAEWLACEDPEPMLWFVEQRASDRKLRLFACSCCRRVWELLVDPATRAAVEFSENHADVGVRGRRGFPAIRRAARLAYRKLQAQAAWREYPGEKDVDKARMFAAYAVEVLTIPTPPIQVRALVGNLARAARALQAAPVSGEGCPEPKAQADLLREHFGNPFRPATFDPAWRTSTVVALAGQMYESRDFSTMPILADALQDAGCDSDDVLNHCRDAHATHVRGCWVVDLVLGKS